MPYRLAISSMSLGRCFSGHTLEHKLDIAKKHGYRGIELFHEDLEDVAKRVFGGCESDHQIQASKLICSMCYTRGMEVVCLQPFMHYEGLRDRAEHGRRLEELKLWIQLAHGLGTDIIQIPSTFLPEDHVTDDMSLIHSDLREAADLAAAASPPIRIAYESLAWGTRVDTWEVCWDVVQAVDRPNFGICLDTFNIAARAYADPTVQGGVRPDGVENLQASIARLLETVTPSKVFFVQVVDAERLGEPLLAGHAFYKDDQPPRMSWSRNCRLFYGEKDRGAYLPIREIAAAIFHGLGFEGWVSLELFNRRMSDVDAAVPEELAMRGAASWEMLSRDMILAVEPRELGESQAANPQRPSVGRVSSHQLVST